MSMGAQSMTDETVPVWLRLRRALALPVYAVALILSFVSDALGRLAASIAADAGPGERTDMLYAGFVSRPAHRPVLQIAPVRLWEGRW
jgi:hypothetical protein